MSIATETAGARNRGGIGVEVIFRPGDLNAIVVQLVRSYDWDATIIGLTGSVDPIAAANVDPSLGEPSHDRAADGNERSTTSGSAGTPATTRTTPWTSPNERQATGVSSRSGSKRSPKCPRSIPWSWGVKSDIGNVTPQPINDYEIVAILHRLFRS